MAISSSLSFACTKMVDMALVEQPPARLSQASHPRTDHALVSRHHKQACRQHHCHNHNTAAANKYGKACTSPLPAGALQALEPLAENQC